MVDVKRYIGKTAREALAAVKADLGPDAVVLSNRQVAEGVEIVALSSDQMSALSSTVRPTSNGAVRPSSPPARAPSRVIPPDDGNDFTVTLGDHLARLTKERQSVAPLSSPRNSPAQTVMGEGRPIARGGATSPEVRAFNPPRVNAYGEPLDESRPAQQLRTEPPRGEQRDAQIQALEATNAQLAAELGSIRGMLERQLAGFAWNEMSRNSPARAQIMGELLESGFSATLARDLTEKGFDSELSCQDARNLVRQNLELMLPLANSDSDIIDRGGVYALVGPTGVGKTTTTAKLAARCVVRHGADKLALITTDGYRIGAHEQLRIYGRILGVSVHAVRDAADLRQTLQELRKKHLILIDTIGMSQRDKMVLSQAAMLSSVGCVRRLVVFNSTVRGDTLEDVLRAYDGPDLLGCILSKADEASSLAPVLDVAIRNELQMYYVANGQRVPEDLHLPNKAYLVHRAMREVPPDSPFKLGAADASLLMSGAKPSARKRPTNRKE